LLFGTVHSLPAVAVDDAECRDDRHTDESGQSHHDPAIRETPADHRRQEQWLTAPAGLWVLQVVVSLVQIDRTRHTLHEPRAVRQLPRISQQEQSIRNEYTEQRLQ